MPPSSKLLGVHPALIAAVTKLINQMADAGTPIMVTSGVRTLAEQRRLYAQGRTMPGAIVTNADGIKNRSNHQVHADGWGHAVDVAFLDEHGKPSWAETHPWTAMGEAAEALGLKWGGRWPHPDRPHLELD